MLFIDYQFPDSDKGLSFKSPNIRSFLPKDAKAQHDRTAIRYHYTSASALLAILNTQNNGNGAIRFTDARYMNDRSEHLFFIKRLLEYMDKSIKDYPFCQEVINEVLLKKHTSEEYISLRVSELEEIESGIFSYVNSRYFLFCLCKDSDSLHMWNYYVRNGNYQGYNIGIKPYELMKSFDYDNNEKHDPIRFYFGDVLYRPKKQEEEIKALCSSIEDLGSKTEGNPHSLQFGMILLWSYIERYGLFFKDESFSDEKEYRIVIQFEEALAGNSISTYFEGNKRKINYTFFERNGILVPCLSVPLSMNAVKTITMAPMLESHIASSSMQEFLESNGYKGVEVKQSSIPIRY